MAINIEEILKTIDTSKMEKGYADIHAMCEQEFEIYEYLTQEKMRLTYCYYHTWMCTDTYVGIRVWYLDGVEACISFKPYRKYDEKFYWISKEDFEQVYEYALSLREEVNPKFSTVKDIKEDFVETAKGIDYKKFESFNLKP
jgi:hypothetical protein